MPEALKIRVKPPLIGNGVTVAKGGDGELEIPANSITATYIADGAVAPEKLEGGVASPGNSKLYGTNASGVLGFFDQPVTGGSGSGVTIAVPLTAAGATLHLSYYGSTAPSSLVQSPTGTFTLTVPTGTQLATGCFIGTSAHIAAATWTFKIVDTDGRFVNFIPVLIDRDTFTQQDLQYNGHNPTQDDSVAGTITSVWQNMSFNNFMVLFQFINRYI